MNTIYGSVSNLAVKHNLSDLINQTFKMLPLRQSNDTLYEKHATALLFRIRGMSELFPNDPLWITLLSTLQAAKSEQDFSLFRKTILDACSTISKYQKKIGEEDV